MGAPAKQECEVIVQDAQVHIDVAVVAAFRHRVLRDEAVVGGSGRVHLGEADCDDVGSDRRCRSDPALHAYGVGGEAAQ